MRGATRALYHIAFPALISIHAPHAGSDSLVRLIKPQQTADFNPRSPCGERPAARGADHKWPDFNPRSPCGERPTAALFGYSPAVFQSTLPMRGATNALWRAFRFTRYFNPRSPCGERLWYNKDKQKELYFNPRSPCGERQYRPGFSGAPGRFQSTLPMRGATS